MLELSHGAEYLCNGAVHLFVCHLSVARLSPRPQNDHSGCGVMAAVAVERWPQWLPLKSFTVFICHLSVTLAE